MGQDQQQSSSDCSIWKDIKAIYHNHPQIVVYGNISKLYIPMTFREDNIGIFRVSFDRPHIIPPG